MTLKQVGVQLTADGAATFTRAMSDADRSVQTFGRSGTEAGSKVSAFEQIAIGGLRRVGAAVTDLALRGGRELIGFLGDSLSMAGDFESTLNRFASVTGDAMGEAGLSTQDFSAKFLELGAATQFSAKDAGDAAVELAKGGINVNTIMGEATEATLNLAAAGQLELAPAANIVAKQLGVWGDAGVTATQIADRLSQAANASTVDVDELAAGLLVASGKAKSSGVKFDDLVTTMALLAPGFSSSQEAGTSFKNFLARIIPTTKDATGAMTDLGLYTEATGSVFYDSTGTFVGMQKASELLHAATQGLSEEQRSLYFQTIFGNDAMGAANILAEQGAAGFDKMTAAQIAAGSATDQAAKLNTGYSFAMESLKGSVETVQIVIGTMLLPVLTSLINDAIIPGVNAVMAFATALGASNDPLGMIVAKLGEGATLLGGWIITAIPAVIGGLAQLGAALINWVASQLPAWGAALETMGIQAAIWISNSIPGWQAAAGVFLQQMLTWIGDSLPVWTGALLNFGLKAISWIGDQLPALGTALAGFLSVMVNWVVESLPGWVAQLQTMAEAAIQWVQDALPGLGTNLGKFAGELLAWVVETTGELIPKLLELGYEFTAWIVTKVLPELPGLLLKINEAILNFLVELVKAIGPEIVKLAEKFYSWVSETVLPALPGLLKQVWDAITGWISTTAENIKTSVQDIGTNIIAGITDGVKAAAQGLLDAVVGVVDSALGGVRDFLDMFSPSHYMRDEFGVNMMLGWAAGIHAGAPALADALTGAAQQATESALSAGQATGDSFAAAFQQASSQIATPQSGLAISSGGGAEGRIQQAMSAAQIERSGQIGATGAISTDARAYAVNYHGVTAPPPVPQSFAALVAMGG